MTTVPAHAVPAAPRWIQQGAEYLRFPKISLHDHLDGSLRPETVLEMADEQGVTLPHQDPDALAYWFMHKNAEPIPANWDDKFGLTTALMQTRAGIIQVAREFVLDLAADGVVYGECRWAPEKHVLGELDLDGAVDAVAAGIAEGESIARASGRTIRVRQLLCGMRTSERSAEIAELAVRRRGAEVAGFDLAGHELGHPVTDHLEACRILHDNNVPFTLHGGEHAGVDSLQSTVHRGHPLRIGHGVRIVEDMSVDGEPLDTRTAVARLSAAGPGAVERIELGPLASWIRDAGIPLEVCLTSNSRHVVDGRSNHPLDLLYRLGFTVTVNPDNRLMSNTSISQEWARAVEEFGWTIEDFRTVTLAALDATFLTVPERDWLRTEVIEPLWASALAELA